MRLYIDKENVNALLDSNKEDPELFSESVRLIKKGLQVYYNFPKSEMLTNPSLEVWFRMVNGAGVNYSNLFCPTETIKPDRPVKTNFYTSYDSNDRCSLYLLDIPENTYNIIRDKNSILIGRPEDEMEVFKKLLAIPERPTSVMKRIISWKNYLPVIPFTDVILFDNYYFKDADLYKKNENELIRALASIPKDTFNLVIIVKEKQIDEKLNLEEEYINIKKIIADESHLSSKKCAVTIMTTFKTHSRHIVTNYYTISPTAEVHLKDPTFKSDSDISAESHTNRLAIENMRNLIDLANDISHTSQRIIGDKRSNFISFT